MRTTSPLGPTTEDFKRVQGHRQRVEELGGYPAAAQLCGTTHETVRRLIERREAGDELMQHRPRPMAADPESKSMVEHLVAYAKADLLVGQRPFLGLTAANEAARLWCAEVNAEVHSEIAAVPAMRLLLERSLLRPLPSLRAPLRRGETRTVDRRAGC